MNLIITFFITAISASCSESTFEDSTATQTVRPQSADAECENGDNYLDMKLISDGLSRRPINKKISYIIERKSCATDENISFSNEVVFFDFDALTEGGNLNYQIYSYSENNLLTSGVLNRMPGADLFGNTGDNYALYKTKPLDVDEKTTKIRMDILLNNKSMNSQTPNATTIDTYFRVGDSAPHTELVPSLP